MFELEITIDESMPPYAVYLSLAADGKTLHVTVSPRMEAEDVPVLTALERSVAEMIADAIERTKIDVRYEAPHEVPPMNGRRSVLTWGQHPIRGNGWTLWYYEDGSETAGVEDHFIPGDLADVDAAVRSARAFLTTRWER